MKYGKKAFVICLAGILTSLGIFGTESVFAVEAGQESYDAAESLSQEQYDTTTETTEQGQITGFANTDAPYDVFSCSISEKPSLEDMLCELPETLDVYVDNSDETTELPVTWYCYGDDYENTSYYYYQFRPQWDETAYTLADTIEIPYILLFMYADEADTASVTESAEDGTDAASETESAEDGTDAASVSESVEEGTVFSSYLSSSGSTASVTGKAAETTIFNYLTDTLGCNMATAVGILTNIYKESGFSPTASVVDTNGKISYGICQWNGDRYTALKNYCGSSYNTVEGQLKYLKYELENSEKSAWSKMQGFANSAEGAYNAAYTWAQYFERCAHYYNGTDQYAARGITARDTFWPVYAAAADASVLTISGANSPGTLTYGDSFSITGTITSGSSITKVTVGCYDSNGSRVIGKTVYPGTTSYNIHNLDNYLLFGTLGSGSYVYKITATNSAGTSKTLLSKSFTVKGIYDLTKCTAKLNWTKTTYNGNAKRPGVTVKSSKGTTLIKGTNYTVTYSNNVNAGIATVTITGIGKYSGTITKTFKIRPVKPTNVSATSTKNTVKVTFTRHSSADKYYIYVNGKYTGCTVTKNYYTIKNLKAGTTYKVSVKAVKESNGKKVYSLMSSSVSIKTKK